MTSPIQRNPQTDKTIMPLRGEGNQCNKKGYLWLTEKQAQRLRNMEVSQMVEDAAYGAPKILRDNGYKPPTVEESQEALVIFGESTTEYEGDEPPFKRIPQSENTYKSHRLGEGEQDLYPKNKRPIAGLGGQSNG